MNQQADFTSAGATIHDTINLAMRDEADLALHIDLRGWAEAADFEHVTSRNLGSRDFIELRFKRGQNEDCHDAADAERWLGYIARGMGIRIPPGDCVIEMMGDQFAAWFWWEPRPPGD
jgi:hypothetical protein